MNLRQKRERLINEIAQTIIRKSRTNGQVRSSLDTLNEITSEDYGTGNWLPGGQIYRIVDDIARYIRTIKNALRHKSKNSMSDISKLIDLLVDVDNSLRKRAERLTNLASVLSSSIVQIPSNGLKDTLNKILVTVIKYHDLASTSEEYVDEKFYDVVGELQEVCAEIVSLIQGPFGDDIHNYIIELQKQRNARIDYEVGLDYDPY